MAKIASVANLKGGCGKSTIAVNIAGRLAFKGRSVVLVDADGQGTATHWALQGRLPFAVEHMPVDGPRDVTRWLQRVLAIKADCVIVDCPPHVGAATEAAVGICDLVVIPVFSSTADLAATVTALELVRKARLARAEARGLPNCLMVPSRIDRRTLAGREIESALKQFGEPIGPPIHQRSAFIDACTDGRWIGDFAPGSPADEDVSELTHVVKRRLNL